MRKTMMAAALIVTATAALAEDWDFILVNGAGKPIKTIELAPAGSGSWTANKVNPEQTRQDTVKPGGRTTVHFDKAAGQCRYDIKATFSDGSTRTWSGANLCDNSFITIKLTGENATIVEN